MTRGIHGWDFRLRSQQVQRLDFAMDCIPETGPAGCGNGSGSAFWAPGRMPVCAARLRTSRSRLPGGASCSAFLPSVAAQPHRGESAKRRGAFPCRRETGVFSTTGLHDACFAGFVPWALVRQSERQVECRSALRECEQLALEYQVEHPAPPFQCDQTVNFLHHAIHAKAKIDQDGTLMQHRPVTRRRLFWGRAGRACAWG